MRFMILGEVRQEIDLDNDYTTLYYNGQNYIHGNLVKTQGEQQLNVLDAIILVHAEELVVPLWLIMIT